MPDIQNPPSDPFNFSYRWVEADKFMISFGSTKEASQELPAPAHYQRVERVRPGQQRKAAIERLPLEIIHQILDRLDPGSLASLRVVNSTTQEFVDTLPALHALLQHAPQVLKALGRTDLIDQYSISQLHDALRTSRCVECDRFGPYLYLLRGVRCCFVCLTRQVGLYTAPANVAKKALGLSKSDMKGLPKLHSIPGHFDMTQQQWKRRFRLVNLDAAYSLLHGCSNDREDSQRLDANKLGRLDLGYDRFRFHASIAFASVQSTSAGNDVQHGLWCRGCEYTWKHRLGSGDIVTRILARRTAYSRDEFIEHCKTCPDLARMQASGNLDDDSDSRARSRR